MKKNKFIYLLFIFYINLFFVPAKSDPKFDLGKNVFLNKGNCSACHVLKNAQSEGQIGPNLNQIQPGMTRVSEAVTNGIGVMPAFDGILTKEEIDAVAYYVSKSAAQ